MANSLSGDPQGAIYAAASPTPWGRYLSENLQKKVSLRNDTTPAAALYNNFAGYIYENLLCMLCAVLAAEKNLLLNFSKNLVLP